MVTREQWSVAVVPMVAALTTLCASTAMAGVIDGFRWLGYVGVAVIVVSATGLSLRAIRTPTIVVGLGQLLALLCLLVALFTTGGLLVVLPTPSALSQLGDVLAESVEVVRTGVPPVEATTPVLCLVVIAIGLVAVLVDTLAVAARTPAACGLVLLCVYAVPASLADNMLPWLSFVLGAGSFALLLAVDGAHRHQLWRNRPAMPGTGGGFGSPVAMVSAALSVALLAGATFTVIGTVGQLPGGGGGGGGGGMGLKPFTSLRGMLEQGENVELYRVRGLPGQLQGRYLRAMTLTRFERDGGWQPPERPEGVQANGELPRPPGYSSDPKITTIEIEAVNSRDIWAPLYGTPLALAGLPDDVRYDPGGGMAYSPEPRRLSRYTVYADMTEPSAARLRAAGGDYSEISDVYLNRDNIDQRVVDLARRITRNETTNFDRALALEKYLDGGLNGFAYSEQTGDGSGSDALIDFLFRSKIGFCEQYASSMAILARAIGLPSRVAIGFTGGFASGGYRSITTQDAHAWVEIYFPRSGWTMFDPTPLGDGRGYTPPYSTATDGPSVPEDDPDRPRDNQPGANDPRDPTANQPNEEEPGQQAGAGGGDGSPSGIWWVVAGIALLALLLTVLGLVSGRQPNPAARAPAHRLLWLGGACWALTALLVAAAVSWWLAVLVLLLLLAAAPGVVREWRRRRHRHQIHTQTPGAASAAWNELVAESYDRGAEMADAETVRVAARRLANDHGLGDSGRHALRTVVTEVERSWYGGRTRPDPELARAFDEVVAGLRESSPLGFAGRLLPRSIMRRRKRAKRESS